MKTRLATTLLVASLLVLCAGCSLTFPQLETARSLFPSSQEDSEVDLEQYRWRLSWASREIDVLAVDSEGQLVFTGEDAPTIYYDGLFLTRATDLLPGRRAAEIEVVDGGGLLRFMEAGRLVLSSPCEAWEAMELADGVRWTRRCEGLSSPIVRFVDEAGQVLRLEQQVHPAYPPVVLAPQPVSP